MKNLAVRKKRRYDQIKLNYSFTILLKLINHYSQVFPIIFDISLPFFASFTAQKIASDPEQAFHSLECFLGTHFKSSFLIKTLLELFLPYGYGILLFLIWFIRTRGEREAISRLLG